MKGQPVKIQTINVIFQKFSGSVPPNHAGVVTSPIPCPTLAHHSEIPAYTVLKFVKMCGVRYIISQQLCQS